MRTYWFCERCQKAGKAHYAEHAGIYEVLYSAKNAHAQKSADCAASSLELRVLNLPVIIGPQVPQWAVEQLAEAMQSD